VNKILFIDQYPYIGGGQKVLLDLVSELCSKGYTVSVVAPKGGALEVVLSSLPINFIAIATLNLTSRKKGLCDIFKLIFWTAASLRVLIINKQLKSYDLIYCNGPRQLLLCHIISFIYNMPFVFHVHVSHTDILTRLLIKFSLMSKKCKWIINISQTTKRSLPKIKDSKKVQVINNWVTPNVFSKSTKIIEERLQKISELGQRKYIKKIIVVGRVSKDKGQHIFVEAAIKICKKYDDIVFEIVGGIQYENDGKQYFDNFLNKIKIDKMDSRITYSGPKENMIEVYKNAQVVVIPSIWEEPFGLVAIESMAMGCITISSDIGGLSEIIQDGKNGLSFTAGDSTDLYTKIMMCLTNKIDMNSTILNAQKDLVKHYNPQNQMAIILNKMSSQY